MRTKIKQQVRWFFQDPARTWAFCMSVIMGVIALIIKVDEKLEEKEEREHEARRQRVRNLDAADEAEWFARSEERTFYVVISGEILMSEEDIGENHDELPLTDLGRHQAWEASNELFKILCMDAEFPRATPLLVLSSCERHTQEAASILIQDLDGRHVTKAELKDPHNHHEIVESMLQQERNCVLVVVVNDDYPMGLTGVPRSNPSVPVQAKMRVPTKP